MISRDSFQSHRGVSDTGKAGYLVLYGNDGYSQDPRTRLEVDLVRAWLKNARVYEVGFGLDPADGYTWAMIVHNARGDDEKLACHLWDCVQAAWRTACGINLDDCKTADRQGQDSPKPPGSQLAWGMKEGTTA